MAPPPIVLPGITWLIVQEEIQALAGVVGAPGRADTQIEPKEQALALAAHAPIALSHVITTLLSMDAKAKRCAHTEVQQRHRPGTSHSGAHGPPA